MLDFVARLHGTVVLVGHAESLADRGGAPQLPSQGAAPTNTAEKNASIAVRLETAVG
jgi:hypothetical protein